MSEFKFEHPRTVLNRYSLHAKKSWGQNFLVSEKAVRTIAEACTLGESEILEIGGGLGTLTQSLLHFASGKITVVERDRDMCHVLSREFSNHPRFNLIEGDAAKFDYQNWLQTTNGIIAGNLPYQITGAILKQVMMAGNDMKKAVFMVQQEVADRLCAPLSDKHRGALTVMVLARCSIKSVLRLKPTAFFPPPKVRSAVIALTPHAENLLADTVPEAFDKVVKSAFATRRKTVRNSLSKTLCEREIAEQILQEADISPTLRAQDIELSQFIRLAQVATKHQLV
ncbi:MAG: ribosomal RNA small subunit methyltransferase A [Deltaproteobacteria bacterium]|nr:ribosomal RNA small subunit methyltransferase A [Deltaproteobacteria bacterium]